ncbi:HAD family hydrolase [Aeromonas media]|uniref:HAD family hydrolase n=1 Tax=Aeromonas media TaxID=651 RepID=UPI003CFC286D
MRSIHDYDLYIFDCDGVILDSNQLKIDAMQRALCALSFDGANIEKCLDYFKRNFGKSRFHHVDFFIANFLDVEQKDEDVVRQSLLKIFSEQCRNLYMIAEMTPNVLDFIKSLHKNKYIASGSEQQELNDVFEERGISSLFSGIYGSPTSKKNIISNILKNEKKTNAVMFGDAISDWEAAYENDIDFIFYSPFSNVSNEMIALSTIHRFPMIDDFLKIEI